MFLRLGVAEDDSQLEGVVGRFLAPVLLKTSTTRPAVREKVREEGGWEGSRERERTVPSQSSAAESASGGSIWFHFRSLSC